ncbi:MAG TPA: DNA polymerase III subunit gamma/tau [Actinomycetes bacterium]|nr:DNA polymerase III subunit gamma/tau [Actinomycetes bacterium]
MSYVSLYRKWRPQTFADVVGQDHVVGTLVNGLATGQVHHAMLFTGTRGTGKTSTARILAKALNCERGMTPEPDNTCASCRAITDGSSLDVVEIDAASHGSVDDARELREKALYAPAASRYKVYIIDEAHMVTTQGFNAMLKVLEEPPGHVHFVFCTTEPHKVIEAIRSRCQRHDFRRIRTALLAEHLGKICAAEGVEVEAAALELVARSADGSFRDGLSRLDQVLTFVSRPAGGSAPQVRLADVAHVLGALPTELRFDLGDALAVHRVADVFALVERVSEGGFDLAQFAREALEHVRDLFVLRNAPEAPGLVDTTDETRARLLAQAERFGPGELGRLVRVLGQVHLDLRAATDPRLVLEVGLAAAALPESSTDADALLARIERLERRLGIAAGEAAGPAPAAPPDPLESGAAAPAAARPAATGTPPAAAGGGGGGARRPARAQGGRKRREASAAPAADWSPAEQPAREGQLDFDLVRRSWPVVLERVRAASRVSAMYLEQGQPVALEGRQVQVEFPADARFQAEALTKDGRQQQIELVLGQVLGGDLVLQVAVGKGGASAPGGSPAADPPPGADELAIEPDDGPGTELGSDADARAVADLAARAFGGEVIEERPND